MDTIDQRAASDNRLDPHREIIRQSLERNSNDIGMAMRDVGPNLPSLFRHADLRRRASDDCKHARSIG